MRKLTSLGLLAALAGAATGVHADEALRSQAMQLFGRLEAPSALARERLQAQLGRAVFWDTRLSLDGKTACASCHTAADFSADRRPFSTDARTGSKKVDLGRAESTKKDEDRYVFRVPMLRNIARTAPYFHDGSVERLDEAVRIMASVQLGRQLDAAAVADIVAFLDALTGKVPDNYAPPGERPAPQSALR